jgi:hypothetical protein
VSLTIEEKNLAIARLKEEVKENSVTQNTLEKCATALEGQLKIVARRSNFYKYLVDYGKVTGLGLAPLSKDRRRTLH